MSLFAYRHKQQLEAASEFTGELPFQPIIIDNRKPQPNKNSKSSPKKIIRTVPEKPRAQQNPLKPNIPRPMSNNFLRQQIHSNTGGWQDVGKTVGVFDPKLNKNQLMQYERRVKRNTSVSANIMAEPQYVGKTQAAIRDVNKKVSQQKSKVKKQQTDSEIQHLKKLLKKEKEEKQKNDKIFQEQQLRLEKERKQLKMLEQQIRKMNSGPVNLNSAGPASNQTQVALNRTGGAGSKVTFIQQIPSRDNDSEEVIRQRNKLREEKIQKLLLKKDKLENYNNPLNYTPTLIPLLSKASYKIISTHVSTLTELLIDDILLEQVLLLEEIEKSQQVQIKKQRDNMLLQDFVSALDDFVEDNQLLHRKVGNYDKVQLTQWYKGGDSANNFAGSITKGFRDTVYTQTKNQDSQRYYFNEGQKMGVILDEDFVVDVEANKSRFKSFTKYRDEYDTQNQKMFALATEEIIDDIVKKLALELDSGSSQFVEMVFFNEFR